MGNAKGTELEIKPSSSKDDMGKRNTMDEHKIGFNTRENKVIRFLRYSIIMHCLLLILLYYMQAENQINHFYDSLIHHAQATVEDDEDDEGDDDGFVPRKLFLFSFAHFKVSAVLFVCLLVFCFLLFGGFFFGGGSLHKIRLVFMLLFNRIA